MASHPTSRLTLAALMLATLAVAGCGSPAGNQADPASARDWQVAILGGGSRMAYFNGVEGPITVSAKTLPATGILECPSTLEVPDVWYVQIFNRTGLAKYYRWPMSERFDDNEFRHELVLPPDPPYLIWGSATCGSHEVSIHAVAERAIIVAQLDAATEGERPVPIVPALEWVQVPHKISVPLGQMRGESAIHLDGAFYKIAVPILGGAVDWTPGAGSGTLSTYEPAQVPDGANWMSQVQRGALTNEFRQRQQETGMPGDYPLVLQLDAPAPPGAEWEARPWIWQLQPNIADLGFDYPPKVWVDCQVQQCELSGPPPV